MWNTFGRGILPHQSASAAAHDSPALSLRPPGKMSSPPSEDPLVSFDFLSKILPAIDFGEGFRFHEPFNFDDFGEGIGLIAASGSPSYGAYDFESCFFSAESSVRFHCRCCRCKWRSPNCLLQLLFDITILLVTNDLFHLRFLPLFCQHHPAVGSCLFASVPCG